MTRRPIDKQALLESANRFAAREQYDKAIQDLELVRANEPNESYVLGKLAELYQRRGKLAEAGACWLALARVSREGGFLPKTVAALKMAAQLLQDRPEIHVELGHALKQQGHKLEAAAQYLLAADAYERLGARVEAVDALKRTVDVDPQNAMARVRLGEAYARQNKLDKALEHLHLAATALRVGPSQIEYTKVIERIAFLEPGNLGMLRELGRLYLEQGDAEHALRKLKVCFKAQPRDLDTLTLLGEAFRRQGEKDRAAVVLRQLASIAIDKKDLARARKALAALLEINPADEEARAQLSML